MRFFFKSRQFKIALAIFSVVCAAIFCFVMVGKSLSAESTVSGTLLAPFQKIITVISDGISDFNRSYKQGNELLLENNQLKEEIEELKEQLIDYDKALAQNEFYENYLGIKDDNPDYSFISASLISRDTEDLYKSFTLDKGSMSGIGLYNPVITNEGLVGYITKVGLTTSTVTTILSPDLKLGALDNRTHDAGVVSGSGDVYDKGLCRFSNLSTSCLITVGDYVISSGEGIFPSGLLIGRITNVKNDEYNTSLYADVQPFADFDSIRNVMIINDFDGKSNGKE